MCSLYRMRSLTLYTHTTCVFSLQNAFSLSLDAPTTCVLAIECVLSLSLHTHCICALSIECVLSLYTRTCTSRLRRINVKRDLHQRQKRPTLEAKETYIRGKRGLQFIEVLSQAGTHQCQKRPVLEVKEAYTHTCTSGSLRPRSPSAVLCPGAHAGAACFFFINFLCALDSTRAPPVRFFFVFFVSWGAPGAALVCVCVCVCVCVYRNKLCREHNLWRTRSVENTFYRYKIYREHILQRTRYIENTEVQDQLVQFRVQYLRGCRLKFFPFFCFLFSFFFSTCVVAG